MENYKEKLLEMENYIDKLLDYLIDELIEQHGINWTIQHLMDFGLTQEQLIELKFDQIDIDFAVRSVD